MSFEQMIQIAGAWAWANFGTEVISRIAKKAGSKAKDASQEAWEKFNWNKASKRYHRKLLDLHSEIRVLGKLESVPLEGIYTDVYILDQPTASRRFNIDILREDPARIEDDTTRINGLDLVKQAQSKRLFILGKPGAGKTTFLKFLTLQAAKGHLDRVPIFVSLKEWIDWVNLSGSKRLELKQFLIKQFEICDFPEAEPFVDHLLEEGKAMVLFDGLDEVSLEDDQRSQVINELRDFSRQYDDCLCLITCRVAATDYSFERFTYVEIADFKDEQIFAFVENWFRKDPQKLAMFARDFAKNEHRGLRELANNPLLLTLLCLAFESTLSFPRRRVEIYEEALEALLKKWDATRGIRRDDIYRDLSLGRKRQMFAYVAAKTFTEGNYFIRQNDLTQIIHEYMLKLPSINEDHTLDCEAILKAIEGQHGILIERAHRIYSFSHLTFQEFYTAKYIVDNPSPTSIQDLLRVNRLTDSGWREVILLTASLLSNADFFFDVFRRNIDHLISQEPTLLKLLNWTSEKATTIRSINNPAVIRAIYCYFALLQDRIHDLDANLKIMHELAPVIKIDRIHSTHAVRENARTNVRVLTQALGPNVDDFTDEFDCDLRLEVALSLASAFSQSAHYERLRPLTDKYRAFMQAAIDKCVEVSQVELAEQLTSLTLPNTYAPQTRWSEFALSLRDILQLRRNVGFNWDLTDEQMSLLGKYCAACELLAECLKLAFVTDRKEIERNILTTPLSRR